MKSKLAFLAFIIIGGLMSTGIYVSSIMGKSKERENWQLALDRQLDTIKKAETGILQNMPIYEDYVTPDRERDLRKHLLKDHLLAAEKAGVPAIQSDEDLSARVKAGLLISADSDGEKPYFYYNVPKKYRFFTKKTVEGLSVLSNRFQKVLRAKAPSLPLVKFAISSATRPAQYQQNLRNVNANASFISSHSYALSFDIFYDSFFVDLPLEEVKDSSGALNELRRKSGFLLGEAMRRQLRAMLAETLLQLQNEGILYAIWEKNQRCYHVTILQPAD